MNDDHLKTLEQVRAFLDGTQVVEFSLHTKTERCDLVRRTLIPYWKRLNSDFNVKWPYNKFPSNTLIP